MMNLVLDIGNTAAKWALFEGRTLVESGVWDAECGKVEKWNGVERAMLCASGDITAWKECLDSICIQPVILNHKTPLPIGIDYKTPETLGADRVAAACGAWGMHRGEPCLIIDAGTCITVDYLDAEGVYHGGAIMPGLKMSLRALNSFTAKLPLVDIDGVERATVVGRSTEESIVAGTLGATMLALAGFVALYKEKNPALHVLLTGGDAERLTLAGANGWEMVPTLTLSGLNEIMMYDEK